MDRITPPGAFPIILLLASLSGCAPFNSFPPLEKAHWTRVLNGVQISEVSDQPLLTASGAPIGVRVNYTLTVSPSSALAINEEVDPVRGHRALFSRLPDLGIVNPDTGGSSGLLVRPFGDTLTMNGVPVSDRAHVIPGASRMSALFLPSDAAWVNGQYCRRDRGWPADKAPAYRDEAYAKTAGYRTLRFAYRVDYDNRWGMFSHTFPDVPLRTPVSSPALRQTVDSLPSCPKR